MMPENSSSNPTPRKSERIKELVFYKYRWLLITLAVVAVCGIWLLFMQRTKTKPDFTVVLVTTKEVDALAVTEMENHFSELLGDINGDGKKLVNVTQYTLGKLSQGINVTYSTSTSVAATFLNNDITLYLFDRDAFDTYNIDDGRFNLELAQKYGAAGYNIPTSGLSFFSDLGFTEEYPLYFVFKGETYAFTQSGMTREEYYRKAIVLTDAVFSVK